MRLVRAQVLAQPQRTNTPQAETKAPSLLQHRNMNQSESSTFQSWWLDTASGTLAEPRFSYDFSRVPALSGMVQLTRPLLRTQPGIQPETKPPLRDSNRNGSEVVRYDKLRGWLDFHQAEPFDNSQDG